MIGRPKRLWMWVAVLAISAAGLLYQSISIRASSALEETHIPKTIVTVLEPAAPPAPANPPLSSANVPIILYHETPADFESQLQHLAAHGYTTVTMSDVARALTVDGTLPAKPVVLTFDDGLADQMNAFALLQKYQMKATFYIVTSGDASNWCIGASRRYDQGFGCGDAYLNWDQIKDLDRSGLIEIGSHTVDHLELSKQTVDMQRLQISQSKSQLETQLGHAVSAFAYPYGSYNQTSVNLAQEAGYTTAVTTKPGQVHTVAGLLTMTRLRDVKTLK